MKSVIIKKSDKPGKKMMAIFTRENGRKKTTYFGSAGMDDFTITKDKAQRKRYLDRHRAREKLECSRIRRFIIQMDFVVWSFKKSKYKRF